MKKFRDLPFYFIIIGFILNISLSLYTKASFNEIMMRSIFVTILFAIMGFVLSNVLDNALLNIKKTKKMKLKVQEEVTTSSTFDVKVEADDEDELLRTLTKSDEHEFVEINPEDFTKFMNQDN